MSYDKNRPFSLLNAVPKPRNCCNCLREDGVGHSIAAFTLARFIKSCPHATTNQKGRRWRRCGTCAFSLNEKPVLQEQLENKLDMLGMHLL